MNKRSLAASGIALSLLLVVVGCVFIGNIDPNASFTATPEDGTTPLDVDFDASASSDIDGTIEAYGWDFGDGQTASHTIAVATHQFTVQSVSAVFRVVLTVTDDLGAEDQAFVDITVDP
ncbi:PKD domain-containing protein [Candidatus Bipolaricaulota bacterium]